MRCAEAEEREKRERESWRFWLCGPREPDENEQKKKKAEEKKNQDILLNSKKEQPDNIIIVSDEDPLWVAMRYPPTAFRGKGSVSRNWMSSLVLCLVCPAHSHKHIGIVQSEVVKRLKEFTATSAVVKMNQKGIVLLSPPTSPHLCF